MPNESDGSSGEQQQEQPQQYELAPFTTLGEHDDLVSALAAGPQQQPQQQLASASWDCSVRIWNLGGGMASLRHFDGKVASGLG